MYTPDFMRLNKRLRVYFIRHGESEGNSLGILQGQRDYALSEKGREQSRAAAEYMQGKGIEYVLASPLLRAAETAEIIAGAAGMPAPQHENLLMELETGIFTGMTIREIERKYPREWETFRRQSWEGVPDAESIASLQQRAVAVWNRIIDIANEGPRHIMVVAHGGIIQWLIKTSLGADARWMPLLPTANCGISEFLAHPVPDPTEPGAGSAAAIETTVEAAASYYGSWITINALPYQ